MASIGSTLRNAARLGAWALERGAAILRVVAGDGGPAASVVAPETPPAAQRPDPQRDPTPKDVDDVTIARKVESVIFRPRGRPKATVDVNVVDGVVWLRGVARSPEMIRKLETEAREVPEVVDVQNLLHLPHTPAPTRADTPPGMQHTRRRKDSPPRPRVQPRRLNADKTIAHGEPLPEQLAQQHRGRPASPLGSHEPEPAGSPGAGAGGLADGAPEPPGVPSPLEDAGGGGGGATAA